MSSEVSEPLAGTPSRRGCLKTLAAFGIASACLLAHVIASAIAMNGMHPGDTQQTYAEYLAVHGDYRNACLFGEGEAQRLLCYGEQAPVWVLNSGPTAFVFDRSGKRVDWIRDTGESVYTAQLQPAAPGFQRITRAEAEAWLARGK